MMNAIRRVVVAALLAVWCFPAVSLAKSEPTVPAPVAAQVASRGAAQTAQSSSKAEVEDLATREQKAPELQDFKGGAVVVLGGATLVLVVLLLILLV
jgi:hypothetical protein